MDDLRSGIAILWKTIPISSVMVAILTVPLLIFPGNGALGRCQELNEAISQVTEIVNEALQRQVRLLQRKLNSDDATQREQAEEELLKLGPEVLDYLANEDSSFTAEFNSRLRRVRIGLELAVAEGVVKPKLISLSGSGLKVSDILEGMMQQTGNQVLLNHPDKGQQTLDIQWDAIPFYQAVDQLCEQLQLGYTISGRRLVLSEYPETAKSPPLSYEKGFRTSAASIRSYRNFLSDQQSTHLSLNLKWEPRLRLIRLTVPYSDLEVTASNDDETSHDEANVDEPNVDEPQEKDAGSATGKLEFGISNGESETTFEVPVANLKGLGDEIDVSGKFKALVAGRNEIFRFEDLEKALKEKQVIERSGIRVQLVDRKDDEFFTGFQLTVSFADSKKSLESHFGWVYENPVFLKPAEGEPQMPLTVESAGQTEQESSMLFLFDKVEDLTGWTIEYHSPGILVETEVPFHLKRIRLP